MVSKEYEASLKEAFEGFLRSPENQRGLEELTISLGRALDLLSSPAVLVVLAGITGLLLARLSGKQKRGGEEK